MDMLIQDLRYAWCALRRAPGYSLVVAIVTALGIGVLGLVGAFALTRFMTNIILGVSPTDPPTFVFVTSMLALSGLLAAWVPAHRAVRVNPVVALRHE